MRTDLVDSGLYICNGFRDEKVYKHLTSCFEEMFESHTMREDFLTHFLTSDIESGIFMFLLCRTMNTVGRLLILGLMEGF